MNAPTRKATTRECPVCGHGEADVLNTQRFVVAAEKSVPEQYDVVTCAVCGAAYADTEVSQQQY
jgi:transcription elongation factor Elf1